VLAALKTTDFRRRVLLDPPPPEGPSGDGAAQAVGAAEITEYRPNRVVLKVQAAAGYLVLTDLWFPGWTCTVDGQEAPLYRANYLFRAVAVPAGEHTVVFSFQPASLARGRAVSLATLGLVALVGLVGVGRRYRNGRGADGSTEVTGTVYP
jgi:hypothetical protein